MWTTCVVVVVPWWTRCEEVADSRSSESGVLLPTGQNADSAAAAVSDRDGLPQDVSDCLCLLIVTVMTVMVDLLLRLT